MADALPERLRIATLYFSPMSPWENGNAFHSKLRDEVRGLEVFGSISAARDADGGMTTTTSQRPYATRPNSGHTPLAFTLSARKISSNCVSFVSRSRIRYFGGTSWSVRCGMSPTLYGSDIDKHIADSEHGAVNAAPLLQSHPVCFTPIVTGAPLCGSLSCSL